jgi:hypothetical protein
MRSNALCLAVLAGLLVAGGCSSMPDDMTRYKWQPDHGTTRVDGFAWPDYAAVRNAEEPLPGAGTAELVWSDQGMFAKLLLPEGAPEQLSVNLVYTEEDGTVRKARVRVDRSPDGIETLAQRTDPGTDEWIPADDAMYARVGMDVTAEPPVVHVFLAWQAVGLDGPPKDRAWVVIDPIGSQPAGEKPPVPIRLYVDNRPSFRGASARCPYCTQ